MPLLQLTDLQAALSSRQAKALIEGFEGFEGIKGRATLEGKPQVPKVQSWKRLLSWREVGYWSLLVLVWLLPFELTRRLPIFDGFIAASNLELMLYLLVILAVVGLTPPFLAFIRCFATRTPDSGNYFYQRKLSLALFGLLLLACVASSLFSNQPPVGLGWTGQFLLYSVLWLATPFWLSHDTGRKINRLITALISGAVISASVGFLEFILGMGFAESLSGIFKLKPTTAGTFLRLSGTFDYANVAAVYFEMVLPFAVANLAKAFSTPRPQILQNKVVINTKDCPSVPSPLRGERARVRGDKFCSGQAQGIAPTRYLVIFAWIVVIGILLEAIFLTFSRGAWLGLVAGGLIFLLAVRKIGQPQGDCPYIINGSSSKNEVKITPHPSPLPSKGIGSELKSSSNSTNGYIGVELTSYRLLPTSYRKALIISVGLGLGLCGFNMLVCPLASLRVASQSDQDWYKAAFTSATPDIMTVCQSSQVSVIVSNLGPLVWNATGANRYSLTYHWLDSSNQIINFDVARTYLLRDIPAGGQQTLVANLYAPQQAGSYWLVWDMYQEDVSWFSFKNPTYQKVPVQINDLPNQEKVMVCQALPPPPAHRNYTPPQTLPINLLQPNRHQLWLAALEMIKTRPLLGVGAGSYRLNYGNFTEPKLNDWDKRIFANSLPLEIFANLGLLGGGLLMAFFGIVARNLLIKWWHGQVEIWWQVAVIVAIAAFLGHGLMDYILEPHPIFMLFWLLFGLSALKSVEP